MSEKEKKFFFSLDFTRFLLFFNLFLTIFIYTDLKGWHFFKPLLIIMGILLTVHLFQLIKIYLTEAEKDKGTYKSGRGTPGHLPETPLSSAKAR